MFRRNKEKKSMSDKMTEKYTSNKSYIRGFHVYQEIWTPVTGECLECRHEPRNVENKNAIPVIKDGTVVVHVPRCFSLGMKMFLGLPKSNISCKSTGNRVNREVRETAWKFLVNIPMKAIEEL